jgi:hypothetical protein
MLQTCFGIGSNVPRGDSRWAAESTRIVFGGH